MKRLFFVIVMLALAIAVGINLHSHPGMVVIAVASTRIDMPLSIAILLFMIAYFALQYCLWLIFAMVGFPGYLQNLSRSLRQRRARQLTNKGFIAFNEGDYAQAEKTLIASAKLSDISWLNYLYAAKAVQHVGNLKKQSDYLRYAHETYPPAEVAIDLVKARLEFKEGFYEQSLATLMHLRHQAARHPARLQLLQEIYVKLNLFEPLSELLGVLKRENILSKTEYQALEKKVWFELLATKASFETHYALWQKIPKSSRTDPKLAYHYAKVLNQYHKPIEAQIVLRNALDKQWREELIVLYGQISHPFPQRILKEAENWLPTHSQSPGLLLTLGRLCAKQGLLGKAQRYFEASLVLLPQAQTYAELGALLEKMNQFEQSQACYKKGIFMFCPVEVAEIVPTISMDESQA